VCEKLQDELECIKASVSNLVEQLFTLVADDDRAAEEVTVTAAIDDLSTLCTIYKPHLHSPDRGAKVVDLWFWPVREKVREPSSPPQDRDEDGALTAQLVGLKEEESTLLAKIRRINTVFKWRSQVRKPNTQPAIDRLCKVAIPLSTAAYKLMTRLHHDEREITRGWSQEAWFRPDGIARGLSQLKPISQLHDALLQICSSDWNCCTVSYIEKTTSRLAMLVEKARMETGESKSKRLRDLKQEVRVLLDYYEARNRYRDGKGYGFSLDPHTHALAALMQRISILDPE
jgi:hypothetical protein